MNLHPRLSHSLFLVVIFTTLVSTYFAAPVRAEAWPSNSTAPAAQISDTEDTQTHLYLPLVTLPFTPLIVPGLYQFNNLCAKYPGYVDGINLGEIKVCIPSVEVEEDGGMYFNDTWSMNIVSNFYGCLTKYSDSGNAHIYIEDSAGNRYDHIEVGGSANGIAPCVESGKTYPGWFKFPAATTRNTIFTFYDDGNGVQITPITLKAAP